MPLDDMVSKDLGMYDMYDMWFFYINGKYVQLHETFSWKSSAICNAVHIREYTIHKLYMFFVRTIGTSEINVCNHKDGHNNHLFYNDGSNPLFSILSRGNSSACIFTHSCDFSPITCFVVVYTQFYSLCKGPCQKLCCGLML